jgi:hypothetical protein
MPDRKIEISVDEQVARRLAARAAFVGETLDERGREAFLTWLGNWGLQFAVHVVKPKESLASIARDYYGDLKKAAVIAAFNDIDNPNLISIGQVLRLPEVQPKAPLIKGESPFLFGIHDRGGESLMAAAGRRGWVLCTEALGRSRRSRLRGHCPAEQWLWAQRNASSFIQLRRLCCALRQLC